MYEEKESDFTALFNGIAGANRKIVKNYCCNLSGYHRDIHDISLTYSYFFTKLFSEPNEMVRVQSFFQDLFQKQQELYRSIFIERSNKKENKLPAPGKHGDKHFVSPLWDKYPYFNFIK